MDRRRHKPSSSSSSPSPRRGEVRAPLRHRQVRADHADEVAEDYCEAIAELAASQGEARVTDLARRFGVSHVTVVKAIARLSRLDLVTTSRGRPIRLTPAGGRLARASARRHEVVKSFLLALGLDDRTADREAEGIEHHVGPRTLRLMEAFAGGSRPGRLRK